MRKHGRLMKNIAGLLLLLALLSLLLPFCKFNAGDGNMTLSGIEVIKTGGKAGYTYFKEGRLSENYVIKDRKSTRLNSSHNVISRMPSSA